ncbi:MAG: sigma-54-dependent Fis family transcriptional regulator [Verrucomicrobiales bacterium]|nr:sigma-54-dependent Fis family transcriptional regulator [Verrucomicrobiales bacterium]
MNTDAPLLAPERCGKKAAGQIPCRCLIVEDDPAFAELVGGVLTSADVEIQLADSIRAAENSVAKDSFDLVILDNRLPDGSGFEFYRRLSALRPTPLVIMITGAPELAQAIALTRNGLFDYLTKPVDLDALRSAIARAEECRRRSSSDPVSETLVGQAAGFREAFAKLRTAAEHPEATVLLLGETGTGKDLAARQLHAWTFQNTPSPAPFVALNCSAVPSEMFEAELFGSERGAYTGADKRRPGLIEAAHGGTLFLDEVGDVPLPQQSKLLRFLESGEYRALGSTQAKLFRGRVVAATNRDLAAEAREGRFRQDLLYRLDVVRIVLPPLRTRTEDVPPLVEYLLSELCQKYSRRRPRVRPDDLEQLQKYPFPGNVRELRNILERSLLHTPILDSWLALDRSWLPAVDETRLTNSKPARRRELTPLEEQEYETFKRVLIEEGGAIRRTAARLGVSHQVVLRRLRWWPELRDAIQAKPD